MPDKKEVNAEDIEVLLGLDLISMFKTKNTRKEKINDFSDKLVKLVGALFAEKEGKNLSEEDNKLVEAKFKESKVDEAMEFLNSKIPNIKEVLLSHTLTAKKIVILDALDYQLALMSAANKIYQGKEDKTIENLEKLIDLAVNDKWKDFVNLYQSINKNG